MLFNFLLCILFTICTYSVQCQESEETIEVSLKNGSQFFKWWAEPPVKPVIKFYIYNVTNVDKFLNDSAKPVLKEVGPYVYVEILKKRNIKFHDNGTVSFNPEKIYWFDDSLSNGSEDDVVIVPNIPMLTVTSQSKHSSIFLRLTMSNIMNELNSKSFVELTVRQLLWGYEDLLLGWTKYMSTGHKWPYEEFGLMYNKNGTSADTFTVFTKANDSTKLGLIDKLNGHSHLTYYTSSKCNSLMASDGFIFPPNLTKKSIIHVYDKDWCRILPLVFEKEVEEDEGIPTYRFTPPIDVFADAEKLPENSCFCSQESPCAPSGFFNTSLCQFDLSILSSFPHFYLANDSYRTAFDGISPPNPEKHKFYIDVQPTLGIARRAKTRVQINLAVSHVKNIKAVATFPDIIFPIMWFEEGFDNLPAEVTTLIKLAVTPKPAPDDAKP